MENLYIHWYILIYIHVHNYTCVRGCVRELFIIAFIYRHAQKLLSDSDLEKNYKCTGYATTL